MRENQQSTCPACGMETLDVLYIAQPGEMRSEKNTVMVMFECAGCLWRGSGATLNAV